MHQSPLRAGRQSLPGPRWRDQWSSQYASGAFQCGQRTITLTVPQLRTWGTHPDGPTDRRQAGTRGAGISGSAGVSAQTGAEPAAAGPTAAPSGAGAPVAGPFGAPAAPTHQPPGGRVAL